MCSCGSGVKNNTTVQNVFNSQNTQNSNINENCDITSELLTTWKTIVLCIKTNNKYNLIQLTEFNINSLLGIIQSAINYPDNYCYYQPQLQDFKENILLRIVENVPECINQ